MVYYIISIAIVAILWFLFNPTVRRIREINTLINKDRSVCDVIMGLKDWNVTPIDTGGLKMVITSSTMINALYITYKGERPNNEDIKVLHKELTNENSIVTKAHRANMPVEAYMRNMENNFD